MHHWVGRGGLSVLSRVKLQVEWMDRGCLLAVPGEGMFDEDYQVFISDGRGVNQVLVLGCRDPAAEGKHGFIPFEIQQLSLLLTRYLFSKLKPLPAPKFVQLSGGNFGFVELGEN